MELLPNSMSFRMITTIDVVDDAEIPAGFTGRVRRAFPDGSRAVAWYTDGRLHDPARTHPAYRRYRASGRLKFEMWYRDGLLQDPSPRVPAVRGWYGSGAVHYEERFDAGSRHDGALGQPAIRKFRADGSVRHELRYRHGQRLPSGPDVTRAGLATAAGWYARA